MRRLLCVSSLAMVISGCGEQGQFNWGVHPDFLMNNANANDVENLSKKICPNEFSVSLVESKSNSYRPTLRLVGNKKDSILKDPKSHPTLLERCAEVEHHLSGFAVAQGTAGIESSVSLDIKFDLSGGADDELRMGKTVLLRPARAILSSVDGIFDFAIGGLNMRCPGKAMVSCTIKELGTYKKCDEYMVDYRDTCTFKSIVFTYNFSDHKKVSLDVEGELYIKGNGHAELKFSKVSWDDVY